MQLELFSKKIQCNRCRQEFVESNIAWLAFVDEKTQVPGHIPYCKECEEKICIKI